MKEGYFTAMPWVVQPTALDSNCWRDYAFSNQPQHKYRVASKDKPTPGKHTVTLDFKYDGPGMGKSGTGTLAVDGKQVAQGKYRAHHSNSFRPR